MVLVYGVVTLLIPIAVIAVLLWFLHMARAEHEAVGRVMHDLQQQTHVQEMERQDQEMRVVNQRIRLAQRLTQEQKYPSEVLRNMLSVAPGTVTVAEIKIDGDQLTVSGVAQKREDVLAFKEALDAAQCLHRVVLPLTSLVDRIDTEFSMSATIIPCS